MNELIKINQCKIGDHEVNSVNARELHEYLEIKKDFSDWIKDQISLFKENNDYLVYPLKGENKLGQACRPKIEYILTIETGKHIALMSRTQKGKQIRDYFIEVEKKYINQKKELTKLEILEMALASEKALIAEKEKTKGLEKVIEKQKPLVDFANDVSNCENTVSIGQCAKNIGIGEITLFRFLKTHGILIPKGEKENFPYEQYSLSVNGLGYFDVVETTAKVMNKKTGKEEIYTSYQTRVTGKGQLFIKRRLEKANLLVKNNKELRLFDYKE